MIFNQNAGPSESVPICAVAVSQDNPNDLHRLCPWGTALPSGVTTSESPGSFGTDPQNSMIYMQDWFVNGVFGVHLDQSTGDMKVAWSRPDWRNSDYFSMIGPADQRVLIGQYLEPAWKQSDVPGYNYTEGLLWVDAAAARRPAQARYSGVFSMRSKAARDGYATRMISSQRSSAGPIRTNWARPLQIGRPPAAISNGSTTLA